ncbi:hypothetical protein H0E87_002933 [Populus deltoides]|uniref:KANL3/Tex30 alpha/beta hydrolase-like domain-containing protein n=1 Tax=Populus deltoides TaxID=3696 RepID=A0A8T2ZXI4_POPDE|nr:hypothetical protein H0E87_002933 [Populus deltoides]
MDSSPPTKRRRKTKSEGTNDKSSSSPVVVFAHGAGAPSSSDWMLRWKEMLKNALDAVEVVTFDYPYIAGGKKRAPPKAEKLVEFHKDIVKKTTDKYPAHPLILAGKSMGSRPWVELCGTRLYCNLLSLSCLYRVAKMGFVPLKSWKLFARR